MKFEDIRIYDKDFNLLLILPRYLSVNWEVKFCGYGTGEIQLEKTDEIVKILTENKYLFVIQGDIQSIVTGYKVSDVCIVFTRTMEWLLTKFAVKKFSTQNINSGLYGGWNTENLIKHILSEYLHKDFNVEVLDGDIDTEDMSDFVLNSASDIYTVIKSIIRDSRVGFKFYRDFSDGHFVFEMKKAAKNDNAILCDRYKTSYDSEYNYDIQNEVSGGIFYHEVTNMGKWNGSQNKPELSQKLSNYGKYYTVASEGYLMGMHLYEGDIILCKRSDGIFEVVDHAEPFLVEFAPESKGIFSWTGALSSSDTVSAQKELLDKKPLDMLKCMSSLSYKEDFELGDIVKVKFFAQGMSCEKEQLISEIHIWDEADDSGAVPTTIDIS